MAIYIYTTTPGNLEAGASAQRYAAKLGAKVETFTEEDAAGHWNERPAGGALISKLRRGDAIVCPRLADIARSAVEAFTIVEALHDGGIQFHPLDIGGGDVCGDKRFLATVKALAELRPMRSVKREQRSKGRHLGGRRPFGFQISDDGKLVEDEREQAAIGKARAMHAAGASLRSIRAALGADGHGLSHVTLAKLVRAP